MPPLPRHHARPVPGRFLLLCTAFALFGSVQAGWAQAIPFDLGQGALEQGAFGTTTGTEGGESLASRVVQLLAAVTLLSVLPGLLIMVTCFPFIVTVLSILRQGIGLQQAPPNMLIVTLALFLTWFVMDPVLTEAWTRGIGPFTRNEIDLQTALAETSAPFRLFMTARLDPATFARIDALRPRAPSEITEAPFSVLLPSFLLSEIQRAFEIGFLVYLPFLIIDLVVSAFLMSMGMMMVPPAVVSLPFKLAFFVVADGWSLLAAALVQSYSP